MPSKTYFTKETMRFLADLRKHNDRAWFADNKDRYEQHVKEPFVEFISDARAPLGKLSPHVVADPRPVGGSLFRIYRDVRFSKDKSPYKTHAGAHFRHAAGKDVHAPGLYLHVEPRSCFIAGGMWMPDPKALRKIRDTIVDAPGKWKAVVRSGLEVEGESLTRPPQGYDHSHPFVEDLKKKSFVASVHLSDAQVCGPTLMQDFIGGCRSMQPLMKFLAVAMGAAW